jgi:hypothetical protein
MFSFRDVKTNRGAFVVEEFTLKEQERRDNMVTIASLCRNIGFGFLLLPLISSLAIGAISSPGKVTFSNPNALNTSAIFDSTGTFVLQLTASDGVKSSTATVTIIVNSPVIMPKLSVGSGSAIAGNSVTIPISIATGTTGASGLQFDLILPAGVSTGPVVAGAASTAAGKSVSSNVVGNALKVIIFGLNQTSISAGQVAMVTLVVDANLTTGNLVLALANVSATDLNGTSIPLATSGGGILSVTANKAPVLTIGGNQTILLPASASLTATATDDGAPNPPGALTITWTVL